MHAGIDEAGRGPWAGPVVAAAVILGPNYQCEGLDDSKKLTAKKRSQLYQQIIDTAFSYSYVFIQPPLIDRINIRQATLLAMQRCVARLHITPELVLVDGVDVPKIKIPAQAIVGGDSKVAEISAASIVAKVLRDQYMLRLDKKYPAYGFAAHKGYGTMRHKIAIEEHGVLLHHRKSYAPIKKIIVNSTESALV